MKIMKNAAPKIDFDMGNDKREKERILNKQVSSENGKRDSLKDNHPRGLFELHCLEGLPFRFTITEMRHSHQIQQRNQNEMPSWLHKVTIYRKRRFCF